MTKTQVEEHPAVVPSEHPIAADIHAEHLGWHEIVRLIRHLGPRERMQTGYYTDPDWSVRDLVAHIGTWLAEAQVQLERMRAGTYEGHDIDIDAMNARPTLVGDLGAGPRRSNQDARGVVPPFGTDR